MDVLSVCGELTDGRDLPSPEFESNLPMKRRHSILLTIVALLLVVPLILMMWPQGPLDLSKDEEPFKSMVLPPKSVSGITYMDHGSAAMHLIDKSGIEYHITFPIDYDGILDSYPKAYYGEINDPKMALLKDPARAKAIVVRLLRDHGNEDQDNSRDRVLRALTHRTIPFRVRRIFD